MQRSGAGGGAGGEGARESGVVGRMRGTVGFDLRADATVVRDGRKITGEASMAQSVASYFD